MQSDLLLHPRTKKWLDVYLEAPRQSVLLYGEKGLGKSHIASTLSDQLTSSKIEYQLHIFPNSKGFIPIDYIRQIRDFVKLRTNKNSQKRVVVIEDADRMTAEAQNALLKILEEPPEDCMLILTSSAHRKLLPTILSRTEQVYINQPTIEKVESFLLKSAYDKQQIDKVLPLTGGLIGLTVKMLSGDYSEQIEYIDIAKEVLSSKVHKRIILTAKRSSERVYVDNLLQAIFTLLNAALANSIDKGRSSERYEKALATVIQARNYIDKNVSARLVLTNVLINI